MISAAMFGFYGMILGFIILVVHLCSLRSFGVPYMAPLAPFIPADINDTFVRGPLWADRKRPAFISGPNKVRQGEGSGRPQPEQSRKMVTDQEGDQT